MALIRMNVILDFLKIRLQPPLDLGNYPSDDIYLGPSANTASSFYVGLPSVSVSSNKITER